MPAKISKNQKKAESRERPKASVEWSNTLRCGYCSASSRRTLRPKIRKCQNGHSFTRKAR